MHARDLFTLCRGMFVTVLCEFLLAPANCYALIVSVNPQNYQPEVAKLRPGDTLNLLPGTYNHGLRLHNLSGTAQNPIFISGPSQGAPATFWGQPSKNTISILNSQHMIVRNLELDGKNFPVDAVKCEGTAEWAHHITLENLFIHGYGNNQQSVGISTKCPAWGWVIRGNRIVGAGTGIYLGNSDGSAPFVAGLIERNVILDTLGYNLQIKHQKPRPDLPELPKEPGITIIRHNVLSKEHSASSGPLARPNVLVGHFPLQGAGADDIYLIYGNFFYQNPTEVLFQGEGNIALYNNLFVNHFGDAVRIQPHKDTPRKVAVFHNTVVAKGTGIALTRRAHDPVYPQFVTANSVFANLPLRGFTAEMNLTGAFDKARDYLVQPFAPLGEMDLMPAPGKTNLKALDAAPFRTYLEWNRDFDGRPDDGKTFGAYTSDRVPPRWLPKLDIKPSLQW